MAEENKSKKDTKSIDGESQTQQKLPKENQSPQFKTVNYKPNPKDPRWKQVKKEQFIHLLPHHKTISRTSEIINVDRTTIARWRKEDEPFDEAVSLCDIIITEDLEKTAIDRAKEGSDTLLIFLLKCRDKRFRERYIQELDDESIDYLVSKFVSVVEKVVPKMCPHCKTNMDLSNQISKELIAISKTLDN